MKLRKVEPSAMADLQILYKLLGQRTPTQSISHKGMPTFREHIDFVKSKPYAAWYLITDGEDIVGATYLTENNEIGISVFKAYQGKGYGKAAVEELMSMYEPPFYANIAPNNVDSQVFFKKLGFKFIQRTYAFGD